MNFDDIIIISSKNQTGQRHTIRSALMQQLMEKARRQIMEQEDSEIFKVLDSVAKIKVDNIW